MPIDASAATKWTGTLAGGTQQHRDEDRGGDHDARPHARPRTRTSSLDGRAPAASQASTSRSDFRTARCAAHELEDERDRDRGPRENPEPGHGFPPRRTFAMPP